jgi:hypothetical protein
MATWATVWKVLEALPGTEQGLLHDNPAVRVRGKLVTYLPNNPRSRPAHAPDHEEFLVIRCDLAERAALLAEDPLPDLPRRHRPARHRATRPAA